MPQIFLILALVYALFSFAFVSPVRSQETEGSQTEGQAETAPSSASAGGNSAFDELPDDETVKGAYTTARNYMSLGNLKGAEANFAEVVKRAPNFVPAHLEYAECLEGLGKMKDAVSELELARSVNPDDLKVMFRLAGAYHAIGKDSESIRVYQNLLWLAPNSENAAKAKKALSLLKDHVDAASSPFASIQNKTSSDPSKSNDLGQQATDAYNSGNYTKAVSLFEEALRLHPDSKELTENLAKSYVELGRSELKSQDYAKYQTHFAMGANLYFKLKQYRKAAELYEALNKYCKLIREEKGALKYGAEAHKLRVLAGD